MFGTIVGIVFDFFSLIFLIFAFHISSFQWWFNSQHTKQKRLNFKLHGTSALIRLQEWIRFAFERCNLSIAMHTWYLPLTLLSLLFRCIILVAILHGAFDWDGWMSRRLTLHHDRRWSFQSDFEYYTAIQFGLLRAIIRVNSLVSPFHLHSTTGSYYEKEIQMRNTKELCEIGLRCLLLLAQQMPKITEPIHLVRCCWADICTVFKQSKWTFALLVWIVLS